MSRIGAIRQVQITEQTFYRWRKQYGGMGTDQLKERKRLQEKNGRLRREASDLALNKLILSKQNGEITEPFASSYPHRSHLQSHQSVEAAGLSCLGAAQVHKEAFDRSDCNQVIVPS
ncbi:MAG: transposase [Dinoroseobacter sp.]|nr:transposase [Dinoroseobacter sp.]